MKKLTSVLLRGVGLNRSRPKTRFGRFLRRSELVLCVLGLLYVGLQAFPQVLFPYNLTVQGITLYSRAPLPPEAAVCAEKAAELVQRSELAVPGRRERVFVCNSAWVFRLFGPTRSRVFAFSVPVTGHVFVASADLSRDLARRAAPDFNTRSLSSVVAHEISHGLIRQRLGLVRAMRLPDWVAEGYCDYVARESSFPEAEGLRLFAAGVRDPSMSYRYFVFRQMVRHLIEDQHLSFSQVVARAPDMAAIETETLRVLQQRHAL